MKIAVIGLGQRLSRVLAHLLRAMPEAEPVGWVDPMEAGVAWLRERRGIEPGPRFEDPGAMLRRTRPDLVMIGSPNHLHLEHLRLSLASGARVFCEKPVVRTEDETWALAADLADEPPDRLLVGLVLRSTPLVKRIRDHLAARRLGTLVSMETCEHLHPEHGAFLMRDWRRRREWGGSYLLDKCCHDFDLFNLFAGAPPERVASFAERAIFTPEHAHLGERRYPDGTPAYGLAPGGWQGAEATFDADADVADHQVAIVRHGGGVVNAFHSNTHAAFVRRRWFLAGTEAAMEVSLYDGRLEIRDAVGGEPEIETVALGRASEHYGADPAMAEDLAATLRGERAFPVDVRDAMIAGLSVMAIDRAAREGSLVDCRPLWDRLDAALPARPRA